MGLCFYRENIGAEVFRHSLERSGLGKTEEVRPSPFRDNSSVVGWLYEMDSGTGQRKEGRHLKRIVYFLAGLALLASSTEGWGQEAAKKWGLGTFLSYNMPVFKLKERFSPTKKYGGSWQYSVTPKLYMELEYHRSVFLNGKLAKRSFKWAVDNKYYASPQATSELKFNSVSLNLMVFYPKAPRFAAKKRAHYIEVGLGYYGYDSRNLNFLYPGQTVAPLNTSLVLQPQVDAKTALSVNVAYGVQAFVVDNVAIDLRLRYNMVIGDLRPMYDWGVENKTFPMHLLDIGAGVKFYFWD